MSGEGCGALGWGQMILEQGLDCEDASIAGMTTKNFYEMGTSDFTYRHLKYTPS